LYYLTDDDPASKLAQPQRTKVASREHAMKLRPRYAASLFVRSVVGAIAASWCVFSGGLRYCAAADRAPAGIKTITELPRSENEIIIAFEHARGQACEKVRPGEAIELKSFTLSFEGGAIKNADARGADARSAASRSGHASSHRPLPVPTARRTAFSLGLDVSRADQAKLPLGSGGLIMDYIHDHYVAIQVPVYRDLVDDAIYLGHRPLAAMASFRGARLTQEFVETTASSVANIRGLGLWLRPNQRQTPATLRTAVFVHKDLTAVEGGSRTDAKPNYELVFVRARPREGKDYGGVELHAFATSEQRRRLNYLHSTSWPAVADECSIKGTVVFTEYRLAQRIPSAAATRSFVLRTRSRFSFQQLDELARKNRWTGDALDNLTDTLDAIIDGKIEK
jgi:hypothetical protein